MLGVSTVLRVQGTCGRVSFVVMLKVTISNVSTVMSHISPCEANAPGGVDKQDKRQKEEREAKAAEEAAAASAAAAAAAKAEVGEAGDVVREPPQTAAQAVTGGTVAPTSELASEVCFMDSITSAVLVPLVLIEVVDFQMLAFESCF